MGTRGAIGLTWGLCRLVPGEQFYNGIFRGLDMGDSRGPCEVEWDRGGKPARAALFPFLVLHRWFFSSQDPVSFYDLNL